MVVKKATAGEKMERYFYTSVLYIYDFLDGPPMQMLLPMVIQHSMMYVTINYFDLINLTLIGAFKFKKQQ